MGFGPFKILASLLVTGSFLVHQSLAFNPIQIVPGAAPPPVVWTPPPRPVHLPPLPPPRPRYTELHEPPQRRVSPAAPAGRPAIYDLIDGGLLHRKVTDLRLPRIMGEWREGSEGLRYRVNYLDARGLSRMGPEGLKGYRKEKSYLEPRFRTAARFFGTYPLYVAGEEITAEIELENAGSRGLRDIRVGARQEDFDPSGTGEPLALVFPDDQAIDSIPAGGKVTIVAKFRQPRSKHDYAVYLTQTHLVVKAGEYVRPLIDDAHAGLVDPPVD